MNDTPANPIIMALLFILRCLVPLVILFGISYLLRRLGLVAESPEPPMENHDKKGKDKKARKVPPRKKTPPAKKKRRSPKK